MHCLSILCFLLTVHLKIPKPTVNIIIGIACVTRPDISYSSAPYSSILIQATKHGKTSTLLERVTCSFNIMNMDIVFHCPVLVMFSNNYSDQLVEEITEPF